MWTIERPRASSARAASITSITMKGSTAPRLDVRTPALLGCALASEPGRSLDARNPARRNRRRLLRPILAFAAAALAVALATPAPALTLIRDAEIEATLGRIAAPLLRAAALSPSSVNIYIVDDREPNAFVAGGQNIFVHTGLLTELDSLDQVRAVLAHEIGHLAGGHQTRRDQALQGVKGIAAIGMLGAAAAAVGGAPQAAIAIGAATGQAAQRSALAYGRAEEATADQMALGFLAAAGTDPHAMLDVLAHFRGQDALTGRYADPYAQNHPMWGERLAHDRGPGGEDGAGAPGLRRGPLLVRPHGREARRLHRQPGADPAPLSRERHLRGRDPRPRRRLAPPPGRRPRRRRGRHPDRGPAGRPLLPRPRRPVPARGRPGGRRRRRSTARPSPSRRRSR